jgi:hypothetical protein
MIETQEIDIELIDLNTGQIKGLPANPRTIKDDKFERLKQSIIDDPLMLQVREVVVVERKGRYIAIAGNQRTTACRDLGHTTIVCKVLPKRTPAKVLRAIATKDNVSSGAWDWDILTADWNTDELADFGLDAFEFDKSAMDDLFEKRTTSLDRQTSKLVIELNNDVYQKVVDALAKVDPNQDTALLTILDIK